MSFLTVLQDSPLYSSFLNVLLYWTLDSPIEMIYRTVFFFNYLQDSPFLNVLQDSPLLNVLQDSPLLNVLQDSPLLNVLQDSPF